MGRPITGNADKPPAKGRAEPSQPPATEDDDVEDGDFATPKRDRGGEDDQPL